MLERPAAELRRSYTRSRRFQVDLLKECKERTNSDPTEGRRLVRITLRLFRHLPLNQGRGCRAVQAWGLLAASHRATGDLAKAETVLRLAFRMARRCIACRADLRRRRAFLLRDQRRFTRALAESAEALRLYELLGTSGHDLDGNGVAKCLICRAQIYYEAHIASAPGRDLPAAVADLLAALDRISPEESPKLHQAAVFNLAAALLGSTSKADHLEAALRLEQAARLFNGVEGLTVEKAKLTWARGTAATGSSSFTSSGPSAPTTTASSESARSLPVCREPMCRSATRLMCRSAIRLMCRLRHP